MADKLDLILENQRDMAVALTKIVYGNKKVAVAALATVIRRIEAVLGKSEPNALQLQSKRNGQSDFDDRERDIPF